VLATLAHGLLDIEANDWNAAKGAFSRAIARLGPHYASYQLQAPLAFVTAKLGDVPAARAFGATLPADCYPCIIARGRIETLARAWHVADLLFAEAARQGPSLPFAYADWGAMRLAKVDYDGAIGKFQTATVKGPRFADPPEMWGEALMQKNRSDLALAKFEEADKFAPNWGRLHLEWGKALVYLGRRDEAQKQFAIASHLDLTASDAAALAHLNAQHV
jgi:tetratricopeptide (TPR) repeat protein